MRPVDAGRSVVELVFVLLGDDLLGYKVAPGLEHGFIRTHGAQPFLNRPGLGLQLG